MRAGLSLIVALLVVVASLFAGQTSAATTTVTTTAFNTFSPATVNVDVGDTVTWTGLGGGLHTVKADDGSFSSGSGQNTFSNTFGSAGSFRYYCEIHGAANGVGMAGTVNVGSATATPTNTPAATNTPSPTATPQSACGGNAIAAVMLTSDTTPTTTYGSVRFSLDASGTTLTGLWALNNLSSNITAAHIHRLSDSAIVVPSGSASFSGLSGTGGSFTTTNTSAADVAAFRAVLANPSAYYVNVHTTNNPSGEIRGTLSCAPAVIASTVVGRLTGSAQVPTVTTSGSGNVALTLDPATGSIAGQWSVTGLSSNATAAHIHVGYVGTNGPVIVDFSSQFPAAGGTFASSNSGVSASLVRAVQYAPFGFYVNVHTTAHLSGEVRGQLAAMRLFLPAGQFNAQLTAADAEAR